MAVTRINTTDIQGNETNVDWYANGERADELILNRPIKQVATIVNQVMDDVDANKVASDQNAIVMSIALG